MINGVISYRHKLDSEPSKDIFEVVNLCTFFSSSITLSLQ